MRRHNLRSALLAPTLLCAVLFTGLASAAQPEAAPKPAQAAAPAPAAQTVATPSLEEFLSPRIYGSDKAENTIRWPISVGNAENERLFLDLYPKLQPLAAEGKVRIEMILWGHISRGFPLFLIAQCMPPSIMPRFLYAAFTADQQTPVASPEEAQALGVKIALEDPALKPASMDVQSFDRLLGWCLSQRRAGIVYTESSRHNFIYDYNLERSGVFGTGAVVNRQVIDGQVTSDAVFSLLKDVTP